jgi:hypothetical protein
MAKHKKVVWGLVSYMSLYLQDTTPAYGLVRTMQILVVQFYLFENYCQLENYNLMLEKSVSLCCRTACHHGTNHCKIMFLR